jgi:hypothetical protein
VRFCAQNNPFKEGIIFWAVLFYPRVVDMIKKNPTWAVALCHNKLTTKEAGMVRELYDGEVMPRDGLTMAI